MLHVTGHWSQIRPALRSRFAAICASGALAAIVAACGSGSSSPAAANGSAGPTGRHLAVVAAENFWGSIVAQLGGSQVTVTSIISNPNADPHDYQSSASSARAFATADYVIVNGAGYDGWAESLLSANQSSSRKVFSVAELLGKRGGDNPHFWYGPDYVEKVAGRITTDLSSIDAADVSYYRQRRADLETALKPYHDRISAIKQKFAGQKVASTESIFEYMATGLGLDLVSPPEFMKAVAEGNDPPAETVTAFHQLIQQKQITVLVYNQQTSTDVTNNLRRMAAQQNIPIVGVTETIQPPDSSFQIWMVGELNDLQNALNASALVK
jgi:zinc/manganese transport system substrate-binding protein